MGRCFSATIVDVNIVDFRSNKTTYSFLYFFSFSLNAWRVRRPEVATPATIDSFNTQNGPTEYAQTYYANDLLTPFFRDPSLAIPNEIFLYIALELLIIRKYTCIRYNLVDDGFIWSKADIPKSV